MLAARQAAWRAWTVASPPQTPPLKPRSERWQAPGVGARVAAHGSWRCGGCCCHYCCCQGARGSRASSQLHKRTEAPGRGPPPRCLVLAQSRPRMRCSPSVAVVAASVSTAVARVWQWQSCRRHGQGGRCFLSDPGWVAPRVVRRSPSQAARWNHCQHFEQREVLGWGHMNLSPRTRARHPLPSGSGIVAALASVCANLLPLSKQDGQQRGPPSVLSAAPAGVYKTRPPPVAWPEAMAAPAPSCCRGGFCLHREGRHRRTWSRCTVSSAATTEAQMRELSDQGTGHTMPASISEAPQAPLLQPKA
mmetsp:Transcript_96295/g.241386  ORF Transcript_96295/g.241386 Transcript_96295/m.241386 type:complete len:305 (-) Transcript_96295:556-1470(-)